MLCKSTVHNAQSAGIQKESLERKPTQLPYLVADTQIFKKHGPSNGPSNAPSVHLSVREHESESRKNGPFRCLCVGGRVGMWMMMGRPCQPCVTCYKNSDSCLVRLGCHITP